MRADFEGLLGLAEKLQQSLERHTSDLRRLRVAQQCIAFLMWVEIAFGYFFTITHIPSTYSFNHRLPIQVDVALAVVATALMTSAWYLYSSLGQYHYARHALRLDDKDLTEVVELLREIEPVVAKEEALSVLERVQIRIRLSRFGIGSSLHSGATLTSKELEDGFRARKNRVDQELAKPF